MKKHIPNTITCCNLISGCIATYWALCGIYDMALLFIIIGAVFDFFDGMTARLLNVSSPIGKELDSLADDITFGFAPSAIVFDYLKIFVDLLPWHYIIYAAFVMAAFSALRLAKFNLDERQAMGFIGLPTPANALFWGALIVGTHRWLDQLPGGVLTLIIMMFFSCYLLVSEIPMFGMKVAKGHKLLDTKRIVFLCLAVAAILFVVIAGCNWSLAVLLIFTLYILENLLLAAFRK